MAMLSGGGKSATSWWIVYRGPAEAPSPRFSRHEPDPPPPGRGHVVSPLLYRLLNVAASLLHSWAVDYQPQGRYLLPAVVPMALILGGLKPPRRPRLERWQLALLVAHALLGWAVALLLPGHVPPPPG